MREIIGVLYIFFRADEIYADYKEFRAIIKNTGRIHWEPGGIFKTICQIDITYFPFDDQYCSLMFGAWSYHTNKMNLTNSSQEVNLDSYKPNGEWEMLDTVASRDEFFYECCPDDRFSFTAFKIHMRRRYTFYVMNVILPSMVTSVLLLSIFYCPPSQKVQIGVVVLLSFRIFLLNVTDSIPKTSDHIPLLGKYCINFFHNHIKYIYLSPAGGQRPWLGYYKTPSVHACVHACVCSSRFYINLNTSFIYKDIFTKFAGNVYDYTNLSVQNVGLNLKNKMAAIANCLKIIKVL